MIANAKHPTSLARATRDQDRGKEEVQGERPAEVLLDLYPLMHY